LEKVDVEPEIYTLPGVEDDGQGAANWFTQLGNLEMVPEMVFPEGKLSIKSTLGQVYDNQDAWAALLAMMPIPLSPEHGMWGMISKFTIEGMLEMGGQELPEAVIAMLNAKLNEFDVIEK
ncbi:MAG: beta-galactosidase, partial [Lachnospiraceae bacterium]|nr:beta-galactosidase [Lachnospiraceae bacterium]